MKRIIDLIFSLVIMIVLSPLFLVIALLIKITSRGPIIFKQRRIGINKNEFNIYKFRTMKINTPKNTPTHLLENPERYKTFVGGLLRRTSLDELPQLVNIIKGEMSFIGPRPALYNQYDLILLRDNYNIHKVRPGITGWAQINGRDELEIQDKVEYDRYYVQNWSVGLDFRILIKTVDSVFRGKGIVEGTRVKINIGN
jgi:O-antigen biosynthesis protein WbqP